MAVTVRTDYGEDEQHEGGDTIELTEGHLVVASPLDEDFHREPVAIYAPGRWMSAIISRSRDTK